MSSQEETIDLSMNAKLPSYDGRVSWFRYEDLVRGRMTFTVMEPAKQGPLLKKRLVEDAAIARKFLGNEKLIEPDNGVRIFSISFPSRLLLEGHAERLPL